MEKKYIKQLPTQFIISYIFFTCSHANDPEYPSNRKRSKFVKEKQMSIHFRAEQMLFYTHRERKKPRAME